MPMIKRTLLSATVTWEKYDYFQSVREDNTCSAFQMVTTDQMGENFKEADLVIGIRKSMIMLYPKME